MITAKTSPLYLEQKIAGLLGLTRDELRHVRREVLKKKRDWTILERQAVMTQPAVARVLDYLQRASNHNLAAVDLTPALFTTASEKKEAAADDGELVLLTVESRYPNVRLLKALDPAGGRVDVRVPSNVNFRPRMTLQGRLVKPGVYAMEGRCPRFPGRY